MPPLVPALWEGATLSAVARRRQRHTLVAPSRLARLAPRMVRRRAVSSAPMPVSATAGRGSLAPAALEPRAMPVVAAPTASATLGRPSVRALAAPLGMHLPARRCRTRWRLRPPIRVILVPTMAVARVVVAVAAVPGLLAVIAAEVRLTLATCLVAARGPVLAMWARASARARASAVLAVRVRVPRASAGLLTSVLVRQRRALSRPRRQLLPISPLPPRRVRRAAARAPSVPRRPRLPRRQLSPMRRQKTSLR